MISERTIEEIKARANLVEIIGESVALRRSGSSWSGLCPFHAEKTPSFHVREHGYHCFGCGASGNVISFVMQTKGLSFPEAVEELAARSGIEVHYEGGRTRKRPETGSREAFYRINSAAQEFFVQALNRAEGVVASYVTSRGLEPATIREFGIGFAPRGPAALTEFLRARRVDEAVMLGSGLSRRSARGELYDGYRARLIFPIWADRRHIVAFGGRLIPPLVDEETRAAAPKYINSPEHPAYQKNRTLFGVPQAIQSARETHLLYLVEGYMDVVSLWQAGVRNAVATCGTAVTEHHVRRLGHLANRVIVLFDGDSAGRAAAAKSFPTFLNSGLDVAAVFLPAEDDPDSLARRLGPGTREYLEALPRLSLLECWIDALVQRYGSGGVAELGAAAKGRIAVEVAEVLRRVKNSIERSELTEQAALRLMIESVALQSLMSEGAAATAAPAEPAGTGTTLLPRKSVDQLPRLDQELLKVLMVRKDEIVDDLLKDSDLCLGVDPVTLLFIQGLAEVVRSRSGEAARKDEVRALLREFGESWIELWKRAYQMTRDPEVDFTRTLDQCRATIVNNKLNQQVREIDRQILTCRNESEKISLLQEKVSLTRRLRGRVAPTGKAEPDHQQ